MGQARFSQSIIVSVIILFIIVGCGTPTTSVSSTAGTLVPTQTSAPLPSSTFSPSPMHTNTPVQTSAPLPSPTVFRSPTLFYRPSQKPVITLSAPVPAEGLYVSVGATLIDRMEFRVVGWQITDIKLVFLAGGNSTTCKLTISGSLPIQRDLTFTSEGYFSDEMGIILKGSLGSPAGIGSTATVEWNATSCGNAGKLTQSTRGYEVLTLVREFHP